MKKQLLIIGVTLVFLIAGLSGCLGTVTKNFNGEYEANENTILKIKNINGEIKINSWDGINVTLNAVIRSYVGNDELENINIEVVESNNVIDIETKYLGTGSVQASTDMTIKIPTYVNVDSVITSNGEVQISDIKGNITAHSSNGAMKIADVDGYVKVSSSNGNLEVKGTTGVDDLTTSNGEIYAEIFDFQKNITISTSNGGIKLYINPSLNANIEMTTSNGQISIRGISLNLTLSEEKHKIGKLGDGGNTLNIHTSNGNINLYKLEI
ncbi:MAG: DUF4097 family beta strand repeat protein [Thermoplasmatales archaeon]|nr:MAG: DUF4097 family beta strand repeat protein [Thermoplasmatales archaeon]